MTETIASHIEFFAAHAQCWGLPAIFIFMAVESSFIPFPSEVVMIPAGFLAIRGEMTTGIFWADALLAVLVGLAGSMAGAYVNYFLARSVGRNFLYRYGKYFFLSPQTLERSEEIFRKYGDLATFVCRLLPAIRQLISIPAGLARMNFGRFSFFTALGAGIWIVILTAVGAWFGHLSGDMSYAQLIGAGKEMISRHYGWILVFLVAFSVAYIFVHRFIMGKNRGAETAR
ncbi:MAG: DedA family protein [Victivallaceae bacterium]|nr:DedA family protein [Victivallaceae bacterium]